MCIRDSQTQDQAPTRPKCTRACSTQAMGDVFVERKKGSASIGATFSALDQLDLADYFLPFLTTSSGDGFFGPPLSAPLPPALAPFAPFTSSSGDCGPAPGGLSVPALLAAMSISIFCACCFANSSDAPPDFENSSRSRLACSKSPFLLSLIHISEPTRLLSISY